MSTGEDSELVPRIQRGDLAAFEALYGKYKGQVYRAAPAITRDQSAAEDILQERFLRVYAHIDKIDVTRPLSPWIHRIAVNLSYNWITKRKRWFPVLGEVIEQFLRGGLPSSPEHLPELEELQCIVQEAIHFPQFCAARRDHPFPLEGVQSGANRLHFGLSGGNRQVTFALRPPESEAQAWN